MQLIVGSKHLRNHQGTRLPRNLILGGATLLAGTSFLYYYPTSIVTLKSLGSYAVTSPQILSVSFCFGMSALITKSDNSLAEHPIKSTIIGGTAFFCVGYSVYWLTSFIPSILNSLLSGITYSISSPLFHTLGLCILGFAIFLKSSVFENYFPTETKENKIRDKQFAWHVVSGATLFYACYLLGVRLLDASATNLEKILTPIFSPFLSRIMMFILYCVGAQFSILTVVMPTEMLKLLLNSALSIIVAYMILFYLRLITIS